MSQKKNWTWNVLVKLELDLEFSVQEEQREEGILTLNKFVRREGGRGLGPRKILPREEKGERELDLEYFVQVKGRRREEESKSEEV